MLRRARALIRRLTGSPDERRAHRRYRVDIETTCRALADDTDMPARLRNVSRSGVNLVVPREIPEGTMLRVSIPTTADGPHTSVLACVTNIHKFAEGLWSLGCVFSLELSECEMRLLGGEKAPSKTGDQRAWVRSPAHGTLSYRLVPGTQSPTMTAELVNLAPAGVGMLVSEQLEAGSLITLTMHRHDGGPDRQLLAYAVYVADREDGKRAVGCNFLHELSEKELNELIWQSPR
jgi:PilZ domain-containing protein